MYIDISSEDYREQFASGAAGDYQLIDVREIEEYVQARLPRTVNIPLSEFAQRLDEIRADCPVLLVCRTGVRSAQAALFIAGMGYDEVYNLAEGTLGWARKGYVIESGESGTPE